MKRIALWFSATTTALLLLFGYHASLAGPVTAQATRTAVAAGVVTPSASPAAAGTSAPTLPRPATTATRAASTKRVTANGSAVSTRYGDIQVQIVVTGTEIVKATAITYSTQGRDGEINSYAIPALQNETVTAQSANIDNVSGATYTSDGYRQSLQSALDAVHSS